MSDERATAPTASGSEPTDGLDGDVVLSPTQFVKQVYAFFYRKSVGLVLILAVGLLSLLGVLIPQMPPGARTDPERAAAWVESVRPTLGGWTDPLEAMGLLSMFTSVPFLVASALLALSIVACTVHRIPVLWAAARHPRTRVTARFYDRARLRTSFITRAEPQEAFDVVCADARRRRMRVIVDERGPGLNAYLDRNAWAPFGTALAHAAFVVIMVGFVISAFTGFREEQFTLTVGHPREVGHGTSLVAQAEGFRDSYYEDGSPKDYVADLVVLKDGRRVASQQVRVNTPLSYDGVMFHQAYFGVSAVMRVEDDAGAEVFHGGVALEWTTQDEAFTYGRLDLPDGRTLYVVTPVSGQVGTGIEPGQVRVEIYEAEGQPPVDQGTLDTGVPQTVGGYTLTFEREQQFTGMIVRKDPGITVVWVGFGLLTLGTCMTMLLRHQRLWVRVTAAPAGTRVQMASPDRRDSGFARFFTDMAVRVSTAMGGVLPQRADPEEQPERSERSEQSERPDRTGAAAQRPKTGQTRPKASASTGRRGKDEGR